MKSKKVLGFVAIMVVFLGCGAELATPSERDAYLPQIELADVRVGETLTGRNNIYGNLQNKGDRTLATVVLKIDYLDEEGKSILSATHSPVSSSLFGGKTLGPKSTLEFRIPANDAPQSWAKKVSVEIAELAFTG